MGFLDRLLKREPLNLNAHPTHLEPVAELAGFFCAHAVWCVWEGETLVPLVGEESSSSRTLVRMASERLEVGVTEGKKRIDANPARCARAVLVYDGFVALKGQRTDALIAEAIDYDSSARMEILTPYRPATHSAGFAVYRPKFSAPRDANVEAIGEAFFRGVDAHEQGSKIWNNYLDQSA